LTNVAADGVATPDAARPTRRAARDLPRDLVWVLPSGVVAAWLAARWPGTVAALGRNIPQPEIVPDYVAGCLWALAIGLSIRVWPVRPSDRQLLAFAWAARCFVTLGFMLTYEWNYEVLDTYAYFDNGRGGGPGSDALRIGSGTENITALVALHSRLGLPYYHAIKVTFSLLGLVGVYLLYRAAVRVLGREAPAVFVLLALWPSVLFWSSILGKDPVAFLGIALYTYGVLAWHERPRPSAFALVAAGVLVAMSTRLWMAPILLAPFGFLLTRSIAHRATRFATVGLAAGALLASMVALRDVLLLETMGDLLATVDNLSRGWAEGGSAQQMAGDLTTPAGLAKFLPRGMFTALFRPLPGEVNNLFGLLAGLESAALVVLLGLSLVRTTRRDLAHPLVQWALLLILCWSGVYSVLSYQNLGTAVRFKLQILPVLLGTLVVLARPRGGPRAGAPRRTGPSPAPAVGRPAQSDV
jgi:hypothetical protein